MAEIKTLTINGKTYQVEDTEEEKEQLISQVIGGVTPESIGARANTWLPTITEIGAAPAGYGLGETRWKYVGITDVAQLDDLKTNGGYHISQTIGSPLTLAGIKFNVLGMQVNMMSSSYGEQVVNHTYGIRLRRHFDMGSWQPWEYDNPPMTPGVEYRTTERWNGKPVYTKAVGCGALGHNAADDVVHNTPNIEVVWVSGGYWNDDSTRFSIPYFGGSSDNHVYVSAYGDIIHRVYNGSVYNVADMIVAIKYTKSTD